MAVTYEPIATYSSSGSTNNFTFNTIPSTYTDLRLVAQVKSQSAGGDTMNIQINSLTSYSRTAMQGNGSTAVSFRSTGDTRIGIDEINNSGSSVFTNALCDFMNYSNTTTYKTVLARGDNASSTVRAYVFLSQNTAAISTLTVTLSSGSNFSNGSVVTLYGIKAA